MKVVVKRVGKIGEVQEIEDSLNVLQYLVGGYITTYPLGNEMLVICNEEGLLQGLEPNIDIIQGGYSQTIVGDIVIVKKGEEDFESLEDKHIELLRKNELVK